MTGPDRARIALAIREAGRAIEAATCDVEETEWGLYLWNEAFPLVNDGNTAWVLREPGTASPGSVLRDVADEFRRRHRPRAWIRFAHDPASNVHARFDRALHDAGFSLSRTNLDCARLRVPDHGPTSRVQVREVTADDAGRETAWALARGGLSEESVTAEEGQQLIALARKRYTALGMRFFIATARDAPAGYATLHSSGSAGYVKDLYAIPEARGTGVGSNLVLAAMRASAVAGDGLLGLETVATNDVALRLYRRLGFDVVGTRPDYVRELAPAKTL